jgi:hypothetical protein
MLKRLVIALVATTMSIGFAEARMSSMSHAHFPTCAQGLVSKNCVCRAQHSKAFQLCTKGRYCHTYDGACTQ